MNNYLPYLVLFIFGLTIYLTYTKQLPGQITEASAPKTEFSTERALVHLKQITQAPHYVGTEEHTRVRAYIKSELEALGLDVEIQEQVVYNEKWGVGIKAKNIIARIKGTKQGKALLLLSHYDSAPTVSLGASDDGAGVVTILEGIRAFLAQKNDFKNDIIILISDAEELGLLGASAFVKHHRWTKDVGLVINFEARGSGGASYLLIETNGGNKKLITEFSKANPKVPVGNSLMYSIYKMLPNDTDLTVFREDGDIEGLNFAFIDRFYNYHMASDNYENLDANTLEHQGTYLMAMLGHFSNYDLSDLKTETDNVYFNFPLAGMIYYPFSMIIPMLLIAILIFSGLLFIGIRKNKIEIKKAFKGFIPFLLVLLIAPILTFFAWKAILFVHPQYKDILHGFTYNGYYYIAAFSALALSFAFLVYNHFLKKNNIINLMIAPLFFWVLLSGLVAFYLKGAAFFIIPVYLNLAILGLFIFNDNTMVKSIIATLLSLPVLIIFAPFIQMFSVGLGLIMLAVSVFFIALIWGMLIPAMAGLQHQRVIGYLFLGLGLIFLIAASLKSSYTDDQKKPNTLLYMANNETGKGYWGSFDRSADEWTKQYIGDGLPIENYDSTITQGRYFKNLKLYKEGLATGFLSAQTTVLADTLIGESRFVKIKIEPQRDVSVIQLVASNDINFNTLTINGERVKTDELTNAYFIKKGAGLIYYLGKGESVELEFEIGKDEICSFKMFEVSQDLLSNDQLKVSKRPSYMTSVAFYVNNAIVTAKSVAF